MTQHQDKKDGDCALYVPCSQVQLARVVVCVLVLVDVVCVMIVVLHVDVVRAVDTVVVAIFCSGRCTLYRVALDWFFDRINLAILSSIESITYLTVP